METAAAAHAAAHSAAYKQAFFAPLEPTARSGISSSHQRFDNNIGHLYAPPPPSEYCLAANESYGASCAASSADRSHGVAEGTSIPCFGSSSSADRHPNPADVGLLAGANAVEEHKCPTEVSFCDHSGANAADQHRGVAVCGALAGDDVSNTGRNSETDSETSRAQRVVRDFVREITRGISLQLVRNGCDAASFATDLASSATELVTVSLDKRLRTLCVQHLGPLGQAQHFGLELVIEVAVGTDIRKEVDLSVDDLCVTLVLTHLKALSFRFPKSEDRDIFALCMSMFIDGRREEVERKSR
jgi:hypothetical protein